MSCDRCLSNTKVQLNPANLNTFNYGSNSYGRIIQFLRRRIQGYRMCHIHHPFMTTRGPLAVCVMTLSTMTSLLHNFLTSIKSLPLQLRACVDISALSKVRPAQAVVKPAVWTKWLRYSCHVIDVFQIQNYSCTWLTKTLLIMEATRIVVSYSSQQGESRVIGCAIFTTH